MANHAVERTAGSVHANNRLERAPSAPADTARLDTGRDVATLLSRSLGNDPTV